MSDVQHVQGVLIIMVISDVYRSFIPTKNTFTKYCLTQLISELPWSFEIRVRQYLVNFVGLAGIYKTKPITGCGHGKLS